MNNRQNPSDRFLIQQYLEGDTSVLTTLVKRYHKIFCEKAYWVINDKERAKDIAQESWIIIISKLHTLQNQDSFKSWANRIIYTKAIDAIKRRNKESENTEACGKIEYSTLSISDNDKHIQKALLKAIQKLPKQKQDIIRLFYSEEYSINEISAFLQIPPGTVKSRLFKAREKLKSIVKKILI